MGEQHNIWRPSVKANTNQVPHPGQLTDHNHNQTFTKTCLQTHRSTQIQQLNKEIIAASQSFNNSAKPFGQRRRSLSQGSSLTNQSNAMAPRLVHQQYNSPMSLYSMDNIKKSIEAHSELIAPGVKGINFMRSNEPVNKQSEVYKLVMEEEHKSASAMSARQRSQATTLSSGATTQAPLVQKLSTQQSTGNESSQLLHRVDCSQPDHYLLGTSKGQTGKPVCCECGQPIVGPFAKLQDRFIHPHCFNCSTCGTSLKNSGYFSINDKLYCEIHARHVASVMKHNQNFEPNRLSHQPAPTPVTLTEREPRHLDMQRSRSTSSLVNQATSQTVLNKSSEQAFQQQQQHHQVDQVTKRCTCSSGNNNHNNSHGATTISTMFSGHCCGSCSCKHGQASREAVVWSWRPSGKQHQSSCHMVSSATSSTYNQEKFSGVSQHQAVCNRCHQSIHGPYVLAGQTVWCKPCSLSNFVCTACRRTLLDCGFVQTPDEQRYYCESCYENHLTPVCSKCSQRITGDCLNALGKQWHPNCFVCGHCRQQFGNTSFYLEDNVPYCQRDWDLLFTGKCSECALPIQAGHKWIEALGKNFHANCFKCSICQAKLEGCTFFCKGGKPFCKLHV